MSEFLAALSERVLVFDGAFGTGVQAVDPGHQVARVDLGDLAGGLGAGRTLDAAGAVELERRHHMQLDRGDPHQPGRPDRVPGQPPVGGDAVQAVADRVAVPAADRSCRVADAQPGLQRGTARLHLGWGTGRGDLDGVVWGQPGDVAEDAVAPPAAEVVVDRLDDAGAAAGADLGPGPQAGDPLGVRGQRPDRRGHAGQQRGRGEQDQIDAPAPPGPPWPGR